MNSDWRGFNELFHFAFTRVFPFFAKINIIYESFHKHSRNNRAINFPIHKNPAISFHPTKFPRVKNLPISRNILIFANSLTKMFASAKITFSIFLLKKRKLADFLQNFRHFRGDRRRKGYTENGCSCLRQNGFLIFF